jgi:hypothetical protein
MLTSEQLLALEAWIVSIIRDEDRAADIHESLQRSRCKEEVERLLLKGED